MYKSYKYRIYPTVAQKMIINNHFGACRFIYNLALETKINAWQSGKINLSAYELNKQITDLKKDLKWLCEISVNSLQSSVIKMESAYKSFFNGSGFPKFKSKKHGNSVAFVQSISLNTGGLKLPKIKHPIKIVLDRQFSGKIKRATVSKSPTGKYFVSLLVDDGIEAPKKKNIVKSKTIGIDLGLKDFLITSEGEKVSNPKFLKEKLERLKVLQRRASKKQKGSNNRKKANLRVAKMHEKIANKRTDFLQKLSTKLVSESQATTFCVESLAVKNLIKNHKLAQAISDVSWTEFLRMMEYKCEWSGKNLVKIERFYPSSKTCFECKSINENLSLSDRTWVCEKCGAIHDRDINASKNIKFMGMTGRANPEVPVESRTLVRSKKQEVNNLKR